ncbi:hypothetical protein [Pseudomonas sp. B392_1p]|uniref:hypothetical protein n=1 Tax=Pseudomonas sp. B392_1p TaxID=3457507 RepID=UPI003FD4CDB6
MPKPNERAFLQRVLKDHGPAILYCETLFRISQTLDDLIDGDKPISGDDVYRAFWEALIELPSNPFYRQNEPFLRPLMAAAMQDWRDSVSLERAGDHHGRTLAFVLRDQLTGLVVQCAGIVGGFDWMQEIGGEVRRYFHDETLADYLSEFKTGHGVPDAARLLLQSGSAGEHP